MDPMGYISSLDLGTQPNIKRGSACQISRAAPSSIAARHPAPKTDHMRRFLSGGGSPCLHLFENFKQQMGQKFSESQKSKKEKKLLNSFVFL